MSGTICERRLFKLPCDCEQCAGDEFERAFEELEKGKPGRAPSGQALVASDGAAEGVSTLTGFDPSRGQWVLVCGGRDFEDEALMFAVLDRIDQRRRIDLIIEGGQRTRKPGIGITGGADYWACRWSYARGRAGMRFDADWSNHGPAAGPIRNQKMLDEGKPDLVVPFPGGRGTADMVRRARAAGVPIEHVVLASAIEARRAATTGAVHESAMAKPDAQTTGGGHNG